MYHKVVARQLFFMGHNNLTVMSPVRRVQVGPVAWVVRVGYLQSMKTLQLGPYLGRAIYWISSL